MNIALRFLHDDSGSDLIEYALLTATVGAGAAAALALMPGVLNALYQTWDTSTQHIWDPCDPGAATSCH